ncbi:nucleotidyltransferase family protein [Azospirillum picis]|uniref:Nucleotidyltransferase-like domain-containing protein n=1 Tax=Azospirillum picis TaxID=488438 RepID=A0ABU0MST7_9PROT|nr:GSU2403 family nucleotidyltransferase fold protein [Azospirillum picis]MBP2302818.1 hypothetical protein [Azospirillum picis]MDQ0536520.1 hypothetical protein [Azospirillum picis]
MLDTISLPIQTMFAEVEQRSLDAEFDEAYPENGSFSKRRRNGQEYWYYNGYYRQAGAKYVTYVGPAREDAVTQRVERFHQIKSSFRERRRMVGALKAAGLPTPDPVVGEVVEALWRAGAFRLRCVLVGTVAFQTYAGLIGVLPPMPALMTTDIDVAQFHSISLLVEDSLPPVLDVLRSVESSFQEIPHQMDGRFATKYRARNIEVEFLTQSEPAQMPALGGAAAVRLRFLDYLLHNPVRSVLLHKAGIPVRVPAPERYALHKLIVATRRRTDNNGQAKRDKDIHQAGVLIEALTLGRRHHDLLDAWLEAWERGPKWQAALVHGRSMLLPEHQLMLRDAVRKAGRETGDRPENIGFTHQAENIPLDTLGESEADAVEGL